MLPGALGLRRFNSRASPSSLSVTFPSLARMSPTTGRNMLPTRIVAGAGFLGKLLFIRWNLPLRWYLLTGIGCPFSTGSTAGRPLRDGLDLDADEAAGVREIETQLRWLRDLHAVHVEVEQKLASENAKLPFQLAACFQFFGCHATSCS